MNYLKSSITESLLGPSSPCITRLRNEVAQNLKSPHSANLLELLWKEAPADKPQPDELSAFLSRKRHLLGAQALRKLMASPGQKISAVVLDQMIKRRLATPPPDAVDSEPILVELPIPLSDSKTLREVRLRLDWLLQAKSMQEAVAGDTAALDREISILKQYLQQCTTPQSRIRCRPHTDRTAYLRLHNALNRLLKHARQESPQLGQFIRSHLQTGKFFCWRE